MGTPVKRVAFHTLGCKLNFSEMSTISRDIIESGFKKVNYQEIADIYVLNTCSVTENADKEAKKLIRQAKRKNPKSSIVVIGCYAQLKPAEIAAIDGVDMVLGSDEKFNILDYLNQIDLKNDTKIIESNKDNLQTFTPSFSLEERTRSYLKIQDGCDYTCSFCTIPLARGKSRSQNIEHTIKIAKQISIAGKKEIVLSGVNIGDFGKGSEESFLDLICELDKLEKIKRIRISSIEPNLLTDEIIEFCFKSKKFVPHFHVPLQSGSNKILKSMRRRYNCELYENRIAKIKSINSDICIGVDVIVGFPGESDDDFLDTYNFLNRLDISYLHVFSYSERSNTNAIEFPDKVSIQVRKVRSKMLHILSEKKRLFFQSQFINTKREVLFEYKKNDRWIGYTDNYIKVEVNSEKNLINKICFVTLIKNQGTVLGKV